MTLETDGGQAYTCPDGVEGQFEAGDIEAGRIKLTLERVEGRIDAIEEAHPGDTLPKRVYVRYQRLVKQDRALVRRFNDAVDRHNAILEANCSKD